MRAPEGELPRGATAVRAADVTQARRSGIDRDREQKLTGSLHAKPTAGCAAPAAGLFPLLKHATELADRVRAQAQGGAAR